MLQPGQAQSSARSRARVATCGSEHMGQLSVPSQPQDHLDDLFEAHLASCQRRSAQRMLDDFEKMGVDEDLEQLKAGWAPSFSRRSGFPQPRQSPSKAASLEFVVPALGNGSLRANEYEDESSASRLGAQAEVAKNRISQLEALRCIAKQENDGSVAAVGRRPSLVSKRRQSARVRGSPADPWDAWEERWSQEFQQFDEFERAKRSQEAAEANVAYSRREAQWRQKVEQAKKNAEEAARRRREAQPRSKQGEATHETKSSRGQSSRTGEPKQTSQNQYHSARSENKGNSPPKTEHPSQPPLSTAAPRTHEPTYSCFADFDLAWSKFENKVQAQQPIRSIDIPWPTQLPTISGVQPTDSPAERKTKLRASLVRWHPDKWGIIFDLVCDADQQLVMERVKDVTRRIIEERKKYGG